MEEFNSRIQLGQTYTDSQTQQEGIAVGLSVFEYGCTRVSLEWKDGNNILTADFDEPRLSPNRNDGARYNTDVVLGEKYKDRHTGVKGMATAIAFFEHSCERVSLEWVNDGKVESATFDAPRLQSVKTRKKVATQKTGGPARGTSHQRPNPSRR